MSVQIEAAASDEALYKIKIILSIIRPGPGIGTKKKRKSRGKAAVLKAFTISQDYVQISSFALTRSIAPTGTSSSNFFNPSSLFITPSRTIFAVSKI